MDEYYRYYYSDAYPLSPYADQWFKCLHQILNTARNSNSSISWECTACNSLYGLPTSCVVTHLNSNKIIHIVLDPVDGMDHITNMNRYITIAQQEYLFHHKNVTTIHFPGLECWNVSLEESNALWSEYLEVLFGSSSEELKLLFKSVSLRDIVSMWSHFDPMKPYEPTHKHVYNNKEAIDKDLVFVRMELYKLKERVLLLNQLHA